MDEAKKDNQQKINQQQPNQDIKQNTNGNNPPQNNGGGQPNNGGPTTPPTAAQKSTEFNRACGAIQMSKETCEKAIAAKTGAEAIAALGPDAEKFCNALAQMPCKDIMPKIYLAASTRK
jgi:hypothetical protein